MLLKQPICANLLAEVIAEVDFNTSNHTDLEVDFNTSNYIDWVLSISTF